MIRAWLTALLFLVFAAAPARADELSDLVDKYIAWRGGAAFEQLQAIHEQARVTIGGLNGEGEAWEHRGGPARSNTDLGVARAASAWNAAGAWRQTPSGQIETLGAHEFEDARRNTARDFSDIFHGREGAKLALLGRDARDGKSWAVVRVSFGDQDSYDAFIDPESGALAGWRVTEDRLVRFEGESDWRMVDGVRMPFVETVETDLPGGNGSDRATSIELNIASDPALFTRPQILRRAAFKDGAKSTGWINFTVADHHIYFLAQVNGHEVVVMLDSGAATSVLDRTYAASIGLSPQGEFTSLGTGGADTHGMIPNVAFQVGNMTLSPLTVAAIDLAPISRAMGHPLPLILGNEAFNELAVDIDFANHRLAFLDPDSVTRPEGAAEIPLQRVTGGRAIPVSIEGQPAAPFDFDLGDGAPLVIFPAYYQPRKMLADRPTSEGMGGAIGGFHPQTLGTVRKMEVGGVAFAGVPTQFSEDKESALNSNRTLGNIGLPVLDRFHLIIDYSHDRLFATPIPGAAAEPFARDRIGMVLGRDGPAVVIRFLAPNGPAQAAGLHLGDQITAIDRKPLEAWPAEALAALADQAAGTELELTLKDGTSRRITLADYF